MYKVSDLQTGLLHLVGVRQYYDTAILKVADSLLTSTSGLMLQDAHPLLTLDNLLSISPDVSNIVYPDWNNVDTFRIGDRVTYDTKGYRALTVNVNKQPDTSTDDWEIFNEFSEWLEMKMKASIIRSVQSFINEKKVIKTARSLYESKPLFDGAGSFKDLITGEGKWVGFELAPLRTKGLSIEIKRVGFQSNKAETFNLYLFHSSKKGYVAKQEITVTENYTLQWTDLTDFSLPYMETYGAGGSWFIAYNQNELTGEAINTTRDWSQKPCNCSRGNYNLYKLWSKYLAVTPFKVDYSNEDLWDIEQNIYLSDKNFGLNLELSVYCDYTRTILEQKDMFKDLIFYGLAMDLMREFAYNPNVRINRHAKNTLPSAEKILYEIDGDSRGKEGGLIKSFRLAMDSIKLDFEGIDSLCLPCRRTGIRYKST